jgi:hypothetical protein
MLAERMGEELARSGQVGIAERLASAHNQAQPATVPPTSAPAAGAAPSDAATPANPPAAVERS